MYNSSLCIELAFPLTLHLIRHRAAETGRLPYERLAALAVLSVAVVSVYILSNNCVLGLGHGGRDVGSRCGRR